MFIYMISALLSVSIQLLPITLSSKINEESFALIFTPSEKHEELGYTRNYKVLIDGIVDDSGFVHLLIRDEYTGLRIDWIYQRYDNKGNKTIDTILYSAEYVSRSYEYITAHILLNPDMTVLFIYPDIEFYTCWMKLDGRGDIIDMKNPKWWRGDAKFNVCSAGQDSFHIISNPQTLWAQPKKYYIPDFGWVEEAVQPVTLAHLHYSNNFKLKEKRISLEEKHFRHINIPQLLQLPNGKVFCFTHYPEHRIAWLMDRKGKCYDAENISEDQFAEKAYCYMSFDDYVKEKNYDPYTGLFSTIIQYSPDDSTICVGMSFYNTFYLIKYDIDGRIVKEREGCAQLMELPEMVDKKNIFTSIQQQRAKKNEQDYYITDVYMFYWGFAYQGNFFTQVY